MLLTDVVKELAIFKEALPQATRFGILLESHHALAPARRAGGGGRRQKARGPAPQKTKATASG
jgi:hypothetical protein